MRVCISDYFWVRWCAPCLVMSCRVVLCLIILKCFALLHCFASLFCIASHPVALPHLCNRSGLSSIGVVGSISASILSSQVLASSCSLLSSTKSSKGEEYMGLGFLTGFLTARLGLNVNAVADRTHSSTISSSMRLIVDIKYILCDILMKEPHRLCGRFL